MKSPAAIGAALCLLPLTAVATPAFNWDFRTHYPNAQAQPASLTSQQLASINLLDGYYPTTMTTPNGTGLTAAEMDEVNAMPAYFALSRDPQTGVLSGRGIVVDDELAPAQPNLSQPASFNSDFVVRVERLTDLYARASTAQAPILVQVYSDLIEHFLDQNYLPGGKNPAWMGNGYVWREHGWKTLRMLNTLSADKRDLYALSLAYVSSFDNFMAGTPVLGTGTDLYFCYLPTAHRALALLPDNPAKWQMMQLIRNGLDISIVGTGEARPREALVQLDGSIIHHDGHQQGYAHYSYGDMLQTHINWTTAGFTGPSTAVAIDRLRRGSLSWCFATTGGLNPLHQRMETELRSASSPDDGGMGKGLDFAVRAARLKSAYTGTSIANDLEMAYAAIAKTGVGSTSLPVEWRGITPPSNIDPGSPLHTAALMGNYSHTTNGTSIHRGPGQWYVSLRGQPANWRGGESRVAIGSPDQFNKKAMIGSLMLITTGKNGRKPNEVDSGYFRDGWDYSYFPNVTCQDVPLSSLLPASRWANMWSFFNSETNLTAGANLRDAGVWMAKFNDSCKSGFMFGNRIVLVGNNISGSNLHTGLIQTGHQAPESEPLVLDGASYTADGDWTLGAGGNHKIVDAQGNGYFIHAGADTPALRARRGTQSTTYALSQNWTGAGTMPDFQTSTEFINNLGNFTPTTANFSKVWFDHGASATNQALEYTVLVNPRAGELEAYAAAMADPANAPVTIIRTSKIHRYRDRATATDAAAVFDAAENINRNSLLTVNRPGAYIWRRNNDLIQLSVSSADYSDTTPFAVTLAGNWTVDSSEDTYAVTAAQSGGNTIVTLSYRESFPQRVTLRSQSATAWADLTQAADNTTPYTQFAVNLADAGIGSSPAYAITGGNASGLFAISGNQLVLTRAFTANDAGLQSVSVQVTQGGSLLGTIGVSVTLVNKAPAFTANPVVKSDALPGGAYSDSLAGNAVNASGVGGTLTFSKVSGPAWLNVATTGALSGTPGAGDVGVNTFTVRVTNTLGLTADATLQIAVESNGTLSNASGGSWSSPSNWGSGLVADGSDKTADFGTLNLAANATITLDGARTIGNLVFGDTTPSHDWTLATGTGGPLTLDVSTGTPTITVNNRTATLSVALAGTKGLLKAGTGALALTGANTYTGLTTVGVNGSTNGGTLSFGGEQSLVGGLLINNGTVSFLAGSAVTVPAGASINTGNAGGNNLRILNAAGVVSNAGTLNLWGGATFNLNAGANWTQSGAMVMKSNATYTSAVLNVNAGAVFKYTGASAITLSASSGGNGGNGTLTIAGGSFETGKGFVNTGGTAGAANLTLSGGGVLKLTADVATLASNSGTTTSFNVQFGNGGAIIDTNGFATTITQGIVNVIGQTGSLTKQGAGTLTLSGSNTYTGATTVTGGALAGAGTFAGPVAVQAGGTLAPSGTLTVNNTLTLAGSAQMKLSKTGTTLANDKVSGITALTYGGALVVTHVGPDALAVGDSFQLFAATNYSGNFASFTLPSLAPNLVWDTSKLSVNGSIGVRALPLAAADAMTTPEDAAATIAVLANDSDADGDALAIQAVTQGAHGTVAINGTQVTYTPAPNWNGTDSFNYTITDNKDGTASATVTVTVNAVNDAPVFPSSPINQPNATEDSAYTATLADSATDVDAGDTRTYAKVSGPAWLNVASNGAISGTPGNANVGANSFAVKVTDSAGATATATLNITVTNVNDAPTFTANPISGADATAGVAYTGTLAGSAMDVDAGDTLTYAKVSGPAWLSVAANGTLSGTAATEDVGANSFTVSATDAGGLARQASLNITVTDNFGNGTWTNVAGGTWTSAANWNSGVIAGGVDKTADFSTLNLTADATVTLDGAQTVGSLVFGDTTPSNHWSLNSGSGGALTLDVASGTPAITVSNQTATINLALAGTKGLTKGGAGTLILTGSNTYSGITTVSAGILSVSGDQSAANGGWMINANATVDLLSGSNVAVASGKTIKLANTVTEHSLNVSGTVNNAGALTLGGDSTVTINAGGNWTQSGTMNLAPVWSYEIARIRVNSGGVFTYTGTATIPLKSSNSVPDLTDQSILTLSGGTFVTSYGFNNPIVGGAGSASLEFSSGGALRLTGNIATLATTADRPFYVKLGTGGGVIDTNGFATTITQGITNLSGQSGSLTKRGAGALTLTGTNSYTGATTVEGGTLAGTGSLTSATTVQGGGTIAPGAGGIGTLTINNTLSLAGTAQMEISKSGSSLSADKLSGVSTLTYGGALSVTHSGDALVAGNTFQLFSATTYSGSFAALNLPALGSGLVWDTSKLSVDGTIAVLDNSTSGLPAGWAKADIGSPAIAGTSSASGGVFTLAGSGTGFANGSDQAHFIWQTMSGDGEVKVRLSSMSGGDASNATTGVMIRESTLAGSRFVFCGRRGGGSMQFIRRLSSGGNITNTSNGTNSTPVWVRLARTGNTITASKSTDGSTWTTVGTDTVSMASQINIGIAVSSGNNTNSTTVAFDNVMIVP